MGFRGICKALYDYDPQPPANAEAEAELSIKTGDLLYILEKDSDANWWRARKKVSSQDEDEPEGVVPKNYVKESEPVGKARALFEYTRQTEEELSLPDGAILDVYDMSDSDWTLVGMDGEFGFVPANYIEVTATQEVLGKEREEPPPAIPARPVFDAADSSPVLEQVPTVHTVPAAPSAPANNSVVTPLASVMQAPAPASAATPSASPESANSPAPARDATGGPPEQDEPEPREELGSALPARSVPRPSGASRSTSDRFRIEMAPPRDMSHDVHGPRESQRNTRRQSMISASPGDDLRNPGGFHLYNINEMVSVLGKKKKMPSTLGINIATRSILIAPERAQDGPSQEWHADKMTHYSREGKHVFLELVRPSRSIDFHAGAKDTAEEIVNALSELAGSIRADGLRDAIMAADTKQKKGVVLYDFIAQADDEVTVGVGDNVIIVDESSSKDWYTIRRVKNAKEGVVPRSFVEITGPVTPTTPTSILNSTKSTVEQNRLDEKRLANEALRANARESAQQVGPGVPLPARGSSLSSARNEGNTYGQGHESSSSRRESGRPGSSSHSKQPRSRPDPARIRTWTDRSKSFSVEAQFLGLKDGKINLHKVNGVKIAVPISKMSFEDLEHVERATGVSLASEKAESRKPLKATEPSGHSRVGASVEKPRKSDYDWFQFFLSCEVAVGLCERYAQAFVRDSMDESVLPDVDAGVLRTLGLREGDIIKVMRTLDAKLGRNNKQNTANGNGEGSAGGLFSGPGGALRNNTRKSRPAPAVQTSSVVDPKAFSSDNPAATDSSGLATAGPEATRSAVPQDSARTVTPPSNGFDDDAWDVKPVKEQSAAPLKPAAPTAAAATAQANPKRTDSPKPPPPGLSATLQDLSLLAPAPPAEPASGASGASTTQPAGTPSSAPTGATPAFFAGVGQAPEATPQPVAVRSRPLAPQMTGTQSSSLVPPPPQRPLSAPQSGQPSAFSPPPLLPQMTGNPPSGFQGHVAPPGQSLNEITQARLHQHIQQQQQQIQHLQQQQLQQHLQQQQPFAQAQIPQLTGYGRPLLAQNTGMPAPPFPQMPMMTGAQQPQLQPLQPQSTGFQPVSFPVQQAPFQSMQTGSANSYIPPGLEPQMTGASVFHGPNGTGGLPLQPLQPLQPQKTGPPPDVRFGVTADSRNIMGRRAKLSQATPDNPFGF